MTQKAFYFDPSLCTGCKTCQLACKDYKDLGTDYTFRRIYDYEGGTWTEKSEGVWETDSFIYHVSEACNHCESPACVAACPTGAMAKDEETGLVAVDAEVCIACGSCAQACPYGAPTIDDEAGHSVKCDGCIDRIKAGQQPICVEACLMRCLEFGDVEDMAVKGVQAAVAPLPEPAETGPHFYIREVDCTKPCDDTTGHVANPLEVA